MWALLTICAIMIALGIVLSKKINNATDFLVAGRGLPLFILSFSIAATHFGGGALVGGVQQGAELGIWAGMYVIIGYAVACFVNAFVAPRFRAAANNLTPPDFIETRYGPSKFLRGYHTVVYIFGSIAIIAAQFNAFGWVAQAFGLSRMAAIFIATIVIIIYAGLSGMWGVAVTDLFQLMICFLFLPVVAVLCIEPLGSRFDITVPQLLSEPFFATPTAAKTFLYSLIPTIVGSIFAYEYYLRYQSAKNKRDACLSSVLAGVLLLVLAVPIGMIGASAHILYPDVPSDTVLSHMIQQVLPPWAAVIFLAAVLAAIMSTADSMMTSLAGMCSRDLYHKLFNPDKEYDQLPYSVLIARIASIVGAILAAIIALQFTSIIGLLFWFSPLQCGVMFAPIIIGLYWKGANRTGAYAAVICGAITALIDMSGIYPLPERMLTTMGVATLALVAFSYLGKKQQCLSY